jgi:hypothetical protein
MYQEYNLFYADWRTKQGKRKRKSFKTAEAATAYEAVQKEAARPKKRGVGARSSKLSAPSSRNGKRRTAKKETTYTT